MDDANERPGGRQSSGRTLLVATVFAVAAAVVAAPVSIVFLGPYAAMFFPPGAAIGAFISGGVLWWVAIERLGYVSDLAGASVGGFTALLSHFVMWFVYSLVAVLTFSPVQSLRVYLQLYGLDIAVLTLWAVGTIIVPAGGAIGLYLVRRHRQDLDDSSSFFD